jgi:hypothetical protein
MILKASVLYFAIVFGAGFLLGTGPDRVWADALASRTLDQGGTLKHETLFQKLFITSCLAFLRSYRSWSRDDKLSSVRIAAC